MTGASTAPAHRRVGSSDLFVSPIGLGCWQFSKGRGVGGGYWPIMPDSLIDEVIRSSVDGGINWFDTAEAYGWGESERVLSRTLSALKQSRSDLVVATKWWPLLRTSGSITRSIGRRRRCLDGAVIDLYQVHQPISFSSVEREMDAMAELVRRGEIRHVGVSNFSAPQMRRADRRLRRHGLRLVSNQVWYNLLRRDIERNGILETAGELGVSIIAYSPLAQGILTGRFHDDPSKLKSVAGLRHYLPSFTRRALTRSQGLIDALRSVSERHAATPAQVALSWLISFHDDLVMAIPGATSLHQAVENAGAMKLTLTADELNAIDEASKNPARR